MNKKIYLCGNPNVGKSSIFNNLTSSFEHTGNWCGKTVGSAKKNIKKTYYEITDLPGIYSLCCYSDEEIVTRDSLYFDNPEKIVIVIDSCNIFKSMILIHQVLELNKNIVICLNMIDSLDKEGISIDSKLLSNILCTDVIECSARKKIGINELKKSFKNDKYSTYSFNYSNEIEELIDKLISELKSPYDNRFVAIKLLEGDMGFIKTINEKTGDNILSLGVINILKEIDFDKMNIDISTELNNRSKIICDKVCSRNNNSKNNKLDKILTSKLYGIPIMILMLFIIFYLTIFFSNYPCDLLDKLFSSIGDMLYKFCINYNVPKLIYEPLLFGVYKISSFIISVMFPPLVIFFTLFSICEESGILPRLALNFDKPFSRVGSNGKQCITMCTGFGCNACAVSSCRIFENKKEKLLAILTNSFIPCNGRFPLLISLTSMFLVKNNNSLLTSLYLTIIIIFSMLVSYLMTYILSKTILKCNNSSFILELPNYKIPNLLSILKTSLINKSFNILKKAVKISIPSGALIWLISNLGIFTYMSQKLDGIGLILGLDGVIVLTYIISFSANEIVLPVILMGYIGLSNITFINDTEVIKNILISNGWNIKTAISVIFLCLMHYPCATTLATIKEEVGKKWMIYSIIIPLITGIICLLIFNSFAK